ncbi:protein plastid transcriptionally active 12, chloroplastic, partial [Tanacetum coccineum]
IRRCNNYVVLQSIPCSLECKIVGQILLDHPLSCALTTTADVPAVYLQQFWKTVSKVPDTKDTIIFKLDIQEIVYTVDMFCDTLKLPVETPNNPFIVPVNIEVIQSFMQRVGYQGVVDKVSAFFTKFLAQPWQIMFKVFNCCLTTRTPRHDQTKINILQLFHVVVNRTNVDYAALLWIIYPEGQQGRFRSRAVGAPVPKQILADQVVEDEGLDDRSEEPTDEFSDFVVYEKDTEAEELTGYDLDKKLGRPHPFIDPKVRKPIKEPLTSEELWWNWRKPDKEQWSRWQKKRPDAETVFLKAMAETGQIKLYGEQPTLTETALYRARKHLYKEERLQAEHERLGRDGPIALLFSALMGVGENHNQVIDFRGPDFHEPTPDVLAYLKQNGNITSKEEIDKILASEKVEKVKVKAPISEDDAMAKAVDIGEKEDSDDEGKFDDDENISRNWSVLKTTPELRKTKPKPAKGKGKMTLEEAIADSENLTDFLMDFDQDKDKTRSVEPMDRSFDQEDEFIFVTLFEDTIARENDVV